MRPLWPAHEPQHEDEETILDHSFLGATLGAEPTTLAVDPAELADRQEPSQSVDRKTLVRQPTRRAMATGAYVTVLLGLGLTVYYQWHVTNQLRASLIEMQHHESTRMRTEATQEKGSSPSQGPSKTRLASDPEVPAVVDREALERLGAGMIGANDFRRALTHYRRLAHEFPDARVFRDIVTALEAKLRCADFGVGGARLCP